MPSSAGQRADEGFTGESAAVAAAAAAAAPSSGWDVDMVRRQARTCAIGHVRVCGLEVAGEALRIEEGGRGTVLLQARAHRGQPLLVGCQSRRERLVVGQRL